MDALPEHLKLHIEASILLRDGKPAEAAEILARAEDARPHVRGKLDGQAFEDMRDLDDLTASFFEVVTSNGKYYLIPIERVASVEFRLPQRPRDLIWRPAQMSVVDGPEGEVFLPAIYVSPADAARDACSARPLDRLGRRRERARARRRAAYLPGRRGERADDAARHDRVPGRLTSNRLFRTARSEWHVPTSISRSSCRCSIG